MPYTSSVYPRKRDPRAKHQKHALGRVRTRCTRTLRLSDGAEAGDPPDPTPRSRRSRRCWPRRGQSRYSEACKHAVEKTTYSSVTVTSLRFYCPSQSVARSVPLGAAHFEEGDEEIERLGVAPRVAAGLQADAIADAGRFVPGTNKSSADFSISEMCRNRLESGNFMRTQG